MFGVSLSSSSGTVRSCRTGGAPRHRPLWQAARIVSSHANPPSGQHPARKSSAISAAVICSPPRAAEDVEEHQQASAPSELLSARTFKPRMKRIDAGPVVCKDGFCGYGQEMQDAWLASLEGADEKISGSRSSAVLAGIPVASLDVSSVRSTVIKRPLTPVETCEQASAPPRPVAEQPVVAVHPDAERRRLAREARKAKRAGASQVIAQVNWWTTTLSNVVEVNSEEAFHQVLEAASCSGRVVVVDYYAPWCQACRRQFADFTSFAAENRDLVFLKVNAGNLRAMCELQGVERLPSYAVHKPGQGVFMTGFFNKLIASVQSEEVETTPVSANTTFLAQ
eukprot:CAMPEP_0117671360 /NCGR_PEP_ID=MMETSP0804-20121206/13290_1 /TAXON_ID=1074897 /ORGANISM="Tetraselmis astigmatica, Strain CCMP880" /LENGTH=337 /DNA_ID=CAMNT_0005479811 /DNA_START=425 /DNA_END=1438 /DNA_ORIENTATION=-